MGLRCQGLCMGAKLSSLDPSELECVRPCRALGAPPACLPLGAELPRCLLHPDGGRQGGPMALHSAADGAGVAGGAGKAAQGSVVGIVDVGVGASG